LEKTSDKREYRRVVAVLQKPDGKTYDYLSREQTVHIRTAKKWLGDYIKNGIKGLKIMENHGGPKPRITAEDRDAILSVLFNEPHIFGGFIWIFSFCYMCLAMKKKDF